MNKFKEINKNNEVIMAVSCIIIAICIFILYVIIIFGNILNLQKIQTHTISHEDVAQVVEPINIWKDYRLTSYYTNDSTGSGEYVGAGLKTSEFSVNEHGWYTYNGHLVIATATYECLYSSHGACNKWNNLQKGVDYFSYYDIINIDIDNTTYSAIVLDSCGACMTRNRVDLFVSHGKYAIDRGYRGINPIRIEMEMN